MKLMACLDCKRILKIETKHESPKCRCCKKELRTIFAITTAERWQMQDTYNYAQDVLKYLTKQINTISTNHYWFNVFTWPDRLAFFTAILQSYAYVSIYSETRPQLTFRLSNTTRLSGLYYLVAVESMLFSMIVRHVEESGEDDERGEVYITYNPYTEYLDGFYPSTYMRDIKIQLEQFYEMDIGEDLEQAVELHEEILNFFYNKVTILEQDGTQTTFLKYIYKQIRIPLQDVEFIDSDVDKDLIILLEKDRDIMHHSGALFLDIFNLDFRVIDEEKRFRLIEEFFDLLSEDALSIDLQEILTTPITDDFESLLKKIREKK